MYSYTPYFSDYVIPVPTTALSTVQAYGCTTREVDLSKPPQSPRSLQTERLSAHPAGYRVVGDIHANPLRLIYALVETGLVESLSKEAWNNLYNAYQGYNSKDSHEAEQHNRQWFDQIVSVLGNLTLQDQAKLKQCANLVLLGDDLCDRGKNDWFILTIFNTLAEQGLPVAKCRVVQSNHTADFFAAYEQASSLGVWQPTELRPPTLSALPDCGALWLSLQGLNQAWQDERLTWEAIQCQVERYKRFQTLLSYVIQPDGTFVLLSHAPISPSHVQKVAEQLGVPYSADTAQALAQTIDRINGVYHQHLEQNSLWRLRGSYNIILNYLYCIYKLLFDGIDDALSYIWNNREQPRQCNLPFAWCNVHGHCDPLVDAQNHVSLYSAWGSPLNSTQDEGESAHYLCTGQGPLEQQQLSRIIAVIQTYRDRLTRNHSHLFYGNFYQQETVHSKSRLVGFWLRDINDESRPFHERLQTIRIHITGENTLLATRTHRYFAGCQAKTHGQVLIDTIKQILDEELPHASAQPSGARGWCSQTLFGGCCGGDGDVESDDLAEPLLVNAPE